MAFSSAFRAAPHNSSRSLRQDFCSNSKFRKWRNTVCISHFRNCGSGAKRRRRLADAIMRCCPKEALSPACRGRTACPGPIQRGDSRAGKGDRPGMTPDRPLFRKRVPIRNISGGRFAASAVENVPFRRFTAFSQTFPLSLRRPGRRSQRPAGWRRKLWGS